MNKFRQRCGNNSNNVVGEGRTNDVIECILGEVNIVRKCDDFIKWRGTSGGKALTKSVNDRYAGVR